MNRFAICVETGEYAVSLERWKVYPMLSDPDAEAHERLRRFLWIRCFAYS